jgi:hypothetical protein
MHVVEPSGAVRQPIVSWHFRDRLTIKYQLIVRIGRSFLGIASRKAFSLMLLVGKHWGRARAA